MSFDDVSRILREDAHREDAPKRWLLTGVAGFIGSNILQTLLELDQIVIGLDNFSTGHQHNIDEALAAVSPERAARFELITGDVADPEVCARACATVDRVLHQAAIGSVPRSIDDPLETHASNLTGFVQVLNAARHAGVKRVVFASSSAVYGDNPTQPNTEDTLGHQLSPYAATKRADELYAEAFRAVYGMDIVGLRYFNVFGPRQDPNGAYAAVIPRWIDTLLNAEQCLIFGDGETTRDFCFVRNVVEANILAATVPSEALARGPFNIAGGVSTSLNTLYSLIAERVAAQRPAAAGIEVRYEDFRVGDIKHSVADVSRAKDALGFVANISVAQGLDSAIDWYIADAEKRSA